MYVSPPIHVNRSKMAPLTILESKVYAICVKPVFGHPSYGQLTAVKKVSANLCHMPVSRAQVCNSLR